MASPQGQGMNNEMKFREVICPYCGNAQDEEVENDSFVCEVCDRIFTSDNEEGAND